MGKHFDKTRLDALVALLQPERRTRVVEVGANPINDNPYADLRDAGHCDVWGFEPNPVAFKRLTSSEHQTYLPHAIGTGRIGTLYITHAAAMTSLLKPDQETIDYLARFGNSTKVEEEAEVQTRALDDLADVPEFDLLKIDVQGGEAQVFEGAAKKLSSAQMVISEVAFLPLYEDQPLLDVQMRTLREHGFDLHKFMFISSFALLGGLAGKLNKRRHRNQMLDGDAVFTRSLRRPDALSDEQIKHLAILCDAVAESFDMVLRCLDLLIARGVVDAGAAEDYAARLPHLADA